MDMVGDPIELKLRDPAAGDETDAAVALLVMGAEEDIGWTTGYYWCRPGADNPVDEVETWQKARQEGCGPFTDADGAILAAQTATPESMDMAFRLGQAAETVRIGHIEPDLASVIEWIEISEGIDRQRREKNGPDSGRTALGLHCDDSREAHLAHLATLPEQDTSEWTDERIKELAFDLTDGAEMPDIDPEDVMSDEEWEKNLDEAMETAGPKELEMLRLARLGGDGGDDGEEPGGEGDAEAAEGTAETGDATPEARDAPPGTGEAPPPAAAEPAGEDAAAAGTK